MAFQEAQEFLGRREGFVFKLGEKGLGFYEEEEQKVERIHFGDHTVQVEVDKKMSGYTGLRIWPSTQRLGLSPEVISMVILPCL